MPRQRPSRPFGSWLAVALLLTAIAMFLQPKAESRVLQSDYSNFKHSAGRHPELECNACHKRTSDNSVTPAFPGHSACQSCHLAQFVNPADAMCTICHVDVASGSTALKAFTPKFKEGFNVRFDH